VLKSGSCGGESDVGSLFVFLFLGRHITISTLRH
jgi:hypothetical protein